MSRPNKLSFLSKMAVISSIVRHTWKHRDNIAEWSVWAGRATLEIVCAGKTMLTIAEDSMFQSRISEVVLQPPTNIPSKPSRLLDYLIIGNLYDARNIKHLKLQGVTHVINCTPIDIFPVKDENPYPESTGIRKYLQFKADDTDNYNMLQHFQQARAFIDEAVAEGGTVFVHCAMGINRSGFICVGYIMMTHQMDLVSAVRFVKDRRTCVLQNPGFQRQLISLARDCGLLYPATT